MIGPGRFTVTAVRLCQKELCLEGFAKCTNLGYPSHAFVDRAVLSARQSGLINHLELTDLRAAQRAPGMRMSGHDKIHRLTVPKILERKAGKPIVCLTAYTAPMARLLDPHVDLLLVGDSVAMVIYGMDTTLGITLDHMILHGQAVTRGARRALVAVDMPFGTYEESPAVAYRNAVRIIQETGCAAVKLEGGVRMKETITFLVDRGIPVMGHVGLLPQSINMKGGYRVVGRQRREWSEVESDAQAVADAGAFCVVLEGVAEPLAKRITESIPIPTIGIGASSHCDGQILVTEDMIGLSEHTPSFVKKYLHLDEMIVSAAESYASDVRARRFPGTGHVYGLKAVPKRVVS
jgi:3-methyl-2-oxobutanoate hydroxymethyltransferase